MTSGPERRHAASPVHRTEAGVVALLATVALGLGGPAASQEVPTSVAVSTALETALTTAFTQEVARRDRSGLAEVVSKQIAVARNEASLHLELADGRELEIRFEEGRVHVGDEEIGTFDEEAEGAWRELLGRAVALDDGPLARALVDWEPPEGGDGVLARIDQALEQALERPAADADAPRTSTELGLTLSRLLTRTERLGSLAAALEDLEVDELTVRIGEDVVVGRDEEIEGTLLVIDGDVELEGRVREHVVVVGGTLRTFAGSEIEGDVRLADARLVRNGGTVAGIVREVDAGSFEAELEARLREAEARGEAAQRAAERAVQVRSEGRDRGGFLAPFRSLSRSIGRGIAGLMETFVALVVLSLLGGLTVLFGQHNLEVVAETARKSPGRSAVVGLAGAFLTFPVWLLGTVALAISIIGIPVMIAWLPLFPLAIVAAAALGYFAVAHNTGQWLARRRYPYLDWIRTSNVYTLVVGGVLGLLGAFFLGHMVSLFGPWLGFLKGMLMAAGVVITTAAALIGFGAVLLTRAGRRPEYWGGGGDHFDDWGWDPGPPSPGPTTGPGGGTGSASSGAGPRATSSETPAGGAASRATGGSGATEGGRSGNGGTADDVGKTNDDA